MPTTDATVKQFVTYDAFMRAIFKDKVLRYKNADITPPSFEEFKSYSIAPNGLSPWLESIRGLPATEKQIYSILNIFSAAFYDSILRMSR